MDICGNVLVSKDVLNFALKCLYCETNIEEWEAFVHHIQSLHNNFEEPCIDPLVELDYKEDIVIEIIKDEVKAPMETTELVNKGTEFKMEIASDEEIVKDELDEEDSGSDYEPSQNNDNDAHDSSNSDSDSIKEEFPQERRKKFNPTFWRRNGSTFAFIELYKNAPCLWDPNDEHYSNIAVRENSQKKIIEEMKNQFNYTLTNQGLKVCFRKLYLQYESTLEAKEMKTKTQLKKLPNVMFEYFEKCEFLAVAKDEYVDAVDKVPNANTTLSFAKLNPTTETFIETYALFPVLYDTKHEDHNNPTARRQAHTEMANIIKSKENIEFTEDEIYKGIHSIRHWYYKTKNRLTKNKSERDLAKSAKVYLQKCSFLPARPPSKKLKCTECDKLFQNETTRQSHLFKEHNIGDWPYKCEQCQRTFEYKAQLIMHEQRTHVGKVHKCDYCERLFAVQVDLQRHIDTHTGHKPFVCELCGKAFRSKTQLGYHSDAIHTKTRAYKCTMCPKDFLKARDLKDHIKAHLNIRDKICETCGKGFTNCHSLIRHRQIHSEVKKFACKLCEAKFHQFVGLNSHMKRTHGIVKNQQ
ncbi:zinc finger protein 431-like [Eurosta solidaginis]|uniref:zinc finger protein 431-like n=1 Tax=Eurosta solidaginis TaxID=178769 RepID=UPI003530A651